MFIVVFNENNDDILRSNENFERHLEIMTNSLRIIKKTIKDLRYEKDHGSTVLGHFNMYFLLNEDDQNRLRKITVLTFLCLSIVPYL